MTRPYYQAGKTKGFVLDVVADATRRNMPITLFRKSDPLLRQHQLYYTSHYESKDDNESDRDW